MIYLPGQESGVKWREDLEAEDIIRLEQGGWELSKTARFLARESKTLQKIQTGKISDSGIGRMCMCIPPYVHARIRVQSGDEYKKALCFLWHKYPNMRMRKGGCPICGR